jgi:peroxiredoxin
MLRKLRIARNLLFAACLSLILSSCAPPPPAPEFDLEKVTGGRVRSSDLKGKVVVVDFWATWCVPCKVEIPHYNELVKKMKGKNFEFIGVTFDAERARDVEPYIEDLRIGYPVVMATPEVDAGFGGHWAKPTTFLVSKDWTIRRSWVGNTPKKMAELEEAINALLAE